MSCPFCSPPEDEIVIRNRWCYARRDRYPVSPGHLLLIPFRHFSDMFEASDEERRAMAELLDEAKELLDRERAPDGYNVGVNVGEAAGQTVMHAHVHLIPRYHGDVEDPRGGVRGAIPAQRTY